MNWRRGLLLAGINLAIAIPGFVWQEAQFWPYTGKDISSRSVAHVERILFQEEQAVDFDPCHWFDIGHSRLEEIGAFANIPVSVATGWHDSCLTRTRLGRVLRGVIGERTHSSEIADCVCLSVLVLIQWTFVGGMPLVRPKRWWLEPGAFITVAAVVGAILSLIPATYALARLLAILAFLGWLWWAALLIRITVHWAWQSTVGNLRRLSN